MFRGSFDGNGHSMKNLMMNNDNSISSVFCGLSSGATIENIKLDKTCEFRGKVCSAISTSATGQVTLNNVLSEAKVIGTTRGSGLISVAGNDADLMLSVMNSGNNGDVHVSSGPACGIVCTDTTSAVGTINIMNSMNGGNIEGSYAYGISSYVTNANNVVSMGIVEGSSGKRSYSLWPTDNPTTSSTYALNETCVNCGNSVTRFMKDSETNAYVINDDHNTRVDVLLNEESNTKDYGMFWSEDLTFIGPLRLIVTFRNQSVVELHPSFNDVISEVEGIKEYFDGSHEVEYMMMDSRQKHIVIEPDMIIKHEMRINLEPMAISAGIDNYVLVIYLKEGNNVTNKDRTKLLKIFCEATGTDADKISIIIETDEDGFATQVIVYNNNENTINTLADCSVNSTCMHRDAVDNIQIWVKGFNNGAIRHTMLFSIFLFVVSLLIML